MIIRVGTSGYSYKEWKGKFYPSKLPAGEMLSYYGSRFAIVEINNTFYRMPSEKVLLDWAGQVPQSFVFVIKAPGRITHQKRLVDVQGEVEYFLRTITVLGPKLGPTLFQLPPNFKKDLTRLAAFLQLLPRGWRAAFEFRNETWFGNEVFDLLRQHNAALCINDMGEGEVNAPFVATADWGYLRLRRVEYPPGQLEQWARQIREKPWTETFVFFKHEEEATGPALADRFQQLVG